MLAGISRNGKIKPNKRNKIAIIEKKKILALRLKFQKSSGFDCKKWDLYKISEIAI